jgi:isochorismate hydrolase
MSIAPIPAYPLPQADELPPNAAAWRIDPARAVVLVHDMQRYFLAPFAEPLRSELIGRVAALTTTARATGTPVLYTAQPGDMSRAQRGLLAEFWGDGMKADEHDRAIIPELAPADPAAVHTKWRYSAFARNGLLDAIRGTGRDQIVLCGVYAHVGVLATAIEAFSQDLETFVVADAIADFDPDAHRAALGYLVRTCAVVLSAADATRSLAVPEGVWA